MMRYLIVIVVLLLIVIPLNAKGPSDRIVITGPTIEGELVVTDPTIVQRLSFASLERFGDGSITEPGNPGDVYYDLERQYEWSEGDFRTFDRARFYPDSKAVFYVGIENGSSGYDGKWFEANPGGMMALEALFEASPYVVLIDTSGMIEFADPVTLEPMSQIEIAGGELPAPEIIMTPDMDTLYFKSEYLYHRLMLRDGRYCVSQIPMLTAKDGLLSYDMALDLAQRKSQETGILFESIRLLRDHRALLHQPGTSGIQVREMDKGEMVDSWQPEVTFAQVIAGGDFLYALEDGPEATTLHMLDADNGAMLTSRTLNTQHWRVGYGWLNLDAVESGEVVGSC